MIRIEVEPAQVIGEDRLAETRCRLRIDLERRGVEETYYRVLVRTRSSSLTAGGRELPIIPGMTASVEIRTGEKSVLDYLLKPAFRAREALRER